MSKTTRATQALDHSGIKFKLHLYDYDPEAASIGLHAAESLQVGPERVFKTLMIDLDGKPVCVAAPSDREVSMKKVAAAFGGKTARMMKPADAERLTGYHVGGISPLGQKKKVRTAIDQCALDHVTIFLNGGQRGLQVELSPQEAVAATQALVCNVT